MDTQYFDTFKCFITTGSSNLGPTYAAHKKNGKNQTKPNGRKKMAKRKLTKKLNVWWKNLENGEFFLRWHRKRQENFMWTEYSFDSFPREYVFSSICILHCQIFSKLCSMAVTWCLCHNSDKFNGSSLYLIIFCAGFNLNWIFFKKMSVLSVSLFSAFPSSILTCA